MKVFQLNCSDIYGGAARAAYRIHHGLRSSGIDSQMLVNVAASGDWTVEGPTSKWAKAISRIRPQLATPLRQLLHTGNPIIHSPALLPSRWPERINASGADVVHLHWVQGEMLSIADIARIRKPIVWTLHDMWAFCGAEHYTTDHRWRDGYRRDNRPAHESGFDLNRHTWQRKRKHWRLPLQIVCPSQWLAGCVRASALMHDWPVAVVSNPIDTDSWQPIDQRLARQLLGLPQDCPLLLFGAIGGGSDPRKGIDLLLAALAHLRTEPNLQTLQLVVFGQLAPQAPPQLGFPVHYTGHLHDDLSLRALYSAADAFVIPSRQENLPNTGLEAQACCTPVVAFNTGGLLDIVADRVTGALAKPFEPASLAAVIRWVLEDPSRRRALGAAARERAERLWAPARVAGMYAEIYKTSVAIGCPSSSRQPSKP
ncbi:MULTISPECIES: glycosyltransferase family 4 protein [unclassified Cyanobium]|uniref:glycosyltransferase family 4 protein n=1 Tax=unclassified Cyanobium TaxID=2627006 RepID=UPI0020CBD823|nr:MULTISPECIES: glycosyltransferase family 4 protein [unclassified Cyanobium]MCP9776962.1 glycosyltransferase family 4 protein [Cyanobium sp. Tous-M-B4]MCP9875228.1 glycosyltransferase family 4 protein [Cyanobium sp. A2C-AMD]